MSLDADAFTWEATVTCTKCGQKVVTTGKMVMIGSRLYPLNLHVDSERAMEHDCER